MINDPANWLALLKQYSSSAEKLAVQKTIIGHMRDEIATQRLAGTDSTLSFRLDGIEMIVNDRKQPEEVYQRFKERYIKVPGYIHDDQLSWTNVSDLQFWDNAAAKEYGIRSIPQNFLIDPQGKIIAKNLRGDELEKELAEVYKD